MNNITSIANKYCSDNSGATIIGVLHGNYGVAGIKIKHNDDIKYLVYKREWFWSFEKQFSKCKGVGISISSSFFDKAIDDNAIIIFCVGSEVFEIPSNKMFDFANKYNTFYHVKQDNDNVIGISKEYLIGWRDVPESTGLEKWID